MSPWLGLFVLHAADSYPFEQSEVARILTEAVKAGVQWPPVQAGLFDGSPDRMGAADQQRVDRRRRSVSMRPVLIGACSRTYRCGVARLQRDPRQTLAAHSVVRRLVVDVDPRLPSAEEGGKCVAQVRAALKATWTKARLLLGG